MKKRYLVLYNCEGKYNCHTYLCKSFKHLNILITEYIVNDYKLNFVEKVWFINSKGELIEQFILKEHFT